MGRRKQGRTEAKLAVKLWGTDASGQPFVDSVITRNVSGAGVLLEGVSRKLEPGDAVGLTYNDQKARFRVTWTGEDGTREEGLVGLESTVPGKLLWDVPLPPPSPDSYVPTQIAERRRFPRYDCKASIEVYAQSSGAPIRGNLADISLGGCYIEMMIPMPVGTQLNLVIWLDAGKVTTPGLVTSSHAGFGVGVKFIGMSKADRHMLEHYLAEQAAQTPDISRGNKGPAPRSEAHSPSPEELEIER